MQGKQQCEHLTLVCKWLNRPDWSTVSVTEGQWQLASPLVSVCIQVINSNKVSLATQHLLCVGWYSLIIASSRLYHFHSTITVQHCAMSIGFKEDPNIQPLCQSCKVLHTSFSTQHSDTLTTCELIKCSSEWTFSECPTSLSSRNRVELPLAYAVRTKPNVAVLDIVQCSVQTMTSSLTNVEVVIW